MRFDKRRLEEHSREFFALGLQASAEWLQDDILARFLKHIHLLHDSIATERLWRGVNLAITCESANAALLNGPPVELASIAKAGARLVDPVPLVLQVMHDDKILAWFDQTIDHCPPGFLRYEYRGSCDEAIFTPKSRLPVPKPFIEGASSYFSTPFFADLRDALTHYDIQIARESQCGELSGAWRDTARLAFLPKPESSMRRSLQKFLQISLRDYTSVEIMPEQNVNETRAVDLKVSWDGRRIALIEIKWLGASGEPGASAFTQRFSAGRAREGCRQLADYLDEYARMSPGRSVMGYLTVFDARRLRLKPDTTWLETSDATHFEHEELEVDQTYLTRPDFAAPIRFYCRPRLSGDRLGTL